MTITGIFAAFMLAGQATAQDDGQDTLTADECVTGILQTRLDNTLEQLEGMPVTLALTFKGGLPKIIEMCEQETGSTSTMYKTMQDVKLSKDGVSVRLTR